MIFSAVPLIPMPHTPMQFHPLPNEVRVLEGMKILRQTTHRYRMTCREGISTDEARLSMLLLFADGSQTEVVADVSMQLMGRTTHIRKQLERLENRLPRKWVQWVYNEKTPEDRFPWDIMYSSFDKSNLYSAYLGCLSRLGKRELNNNGPPKKQRRSK